MLLLNSSVTKRWWFGCALALMASVAVVAGLSGCSDEGNAKKNEGGKAGSDAAAGAAADAGKSASGADAGGASKAGGGAAVAAGASGKNEGGLSLDTIIYPMDEDPKHLDPAYCTDIYEGHLVALLYDGLVVFKPGGSIEIAPGLAEKWETSPDGTVYTFHLRKGVEFQSGGTVTSKDVKYSFERLLSPSLQPISPRATFYEFILGARDYMKDTPDRAREIAGLKVIDDHTVEIRLEKPFAPFLGLLAMPNAAIISSAVGEKAKTNEYLSKNPSGTGPWILEKWEESQYMRFRRNEKYWGGKPKASFFVWRAAKSDLSLAQDYEVGNVDFFSVPVALHEKFVTDPKWAPQAKPVPEQNFYYWAINCDKAPFNDVRVRQALSYAIDVDTILREIMMGRGVRATGATPPLIPGHDKTAKPWPYDPGKAKQLLKEAGQLNADGSAKFEFELLVGTTDTDSLMAEATRDYIEKIGVKTTIVKRENAAVKSVLRSRDYNALYRNWWVDYPDIENFVFPCFHSSNWEGQSNAAHYKNPDVDALIDKGRFMPDGPERTALFQKAEALVRQDCPYIFLWHRMSYQLQQPWITGYEPSAMYNAEKYVHVGVDTALKAKLKGKNGGN